jgi:hypothetical protein
MSDGYEVDVAKLREVANGLSTVAAGLRVPVEAPRADTGASTGIVAEAMERLTDGLPDLRKLCEGIADGLTQTVKGYQRADDRARAYLERIRGQHQ